MEDKPFGGMGHRDIIGHPEVMVEGTKKFMVRDDDQHRALFGEPPVVCNYFYHEEITKTAKKKREE